MRVKINFIIEIDPADWTLNYGIEKAAEIREDVKTYAEMMVRDQLAVSGIDVLN
jgi:hypothetical protein